MSRPLLSDWFNAQSVDLFFDRVVCMGDVVEFELKSGDHHFTLYTGHEISDGVKEPYLAQCWPDCCTGEMPGSNMWKILLGSTDDEMTLEAARARYGTVLPQMEKMRINNELDADWEPYAVDEILQRAKSQTCPSTEDEQSLLPRRFSSCRHFAVWCRYDENYVNSVAEDTENAAAAIKTGATVGVIGAITAGLGYLFYSLTKRGSVSNEEKTLTPEEGKKATPEDEKKKEEEGTKD